MLLLYYNWAKGCSTCKSESTNHHCIIYQEEGLFYHKTSRSMSTLASSDVTKDLSTYSNNNGGWMHSQHLVTKHRIMFQSKSRIC